MAVVKDTKSFIARSRELHGDLYDYSKAVWAGADKPITLICPVHGEFQLKEAGTHYWARDKCGCRHCGIENLLKERGLGRVCVKCNRRTRYMPTSSVCRECVDKAKADRKAAVETARNKVCKNCGKQFRTLDTRQYVCSRECAQAGRKLKRITVDCCVCGKECVRTETQVRERNCCSLECQRRLALVDNRGRGAVDWLARSRQAKALYKRMSAQHRRVKSQSLVVYRRITSELNRIRQCSIASQDPWSAAISSRVGMMKHRKRTGFMNQHCPGSVRCALSKLRAERTRFEKDDWYKKLDSRLGTNLRQRRIRKYGQVEAK